MNDLIEAHLRHLRAHRLAHTTITDRGELLYRLDRLLPLGLERATIEELEDFLANPAYSAQTQATYYGHIVGLFRWATDPARPILDYDPSAGLKRPRVPRTLPRPATDEQVAHALANLDEPWLTYVKLAAYEGARCAEIATMRKEDITDTRTRITGKGGKVRILRTHDSVWSSVRHFPAGRLAHKVRTGAPADADYISNRSIHHLKRIGLAELSLHMFRHWFATTQLRPREFGGGGLSVRAVQENLGHADLSSTAIYTLVADEERDAGIAALPTFTAPASR